MSEVFFPKYFIIMFDGRSFHEKFPLMRKYYDFAHAINCTHRLTCMCAYAWACDRTHLREQYASQIACMQKALCMLCMHKNLCVILVPLYEKNFLSFQYVLLFLSPSSLPPLGHCVVILAPLLCCTDLFVCSFLLELILKPDHKPRYILVNLKG